MNESDFTRVVNSKLPPEIYRWKVSDRFSAGVADCYYSSKVGDIWIEFKYLPKGLPKQVKPKLSKLQIRWLNERYSEGRKVYVVVGSPKECLIYTDQEWNNYKPASLAVSRSELIDWIKNQLC